MTNNKLPMTGRRIQWLSDLVRLEIALWERIDQRLLAKHGLPLSSFETLYIIWNAPEQRLRVGEISQSLGVTVGGTSKIIDRLDRAGLIAREPDPDDRRAAQIVLTPIGQRTVAQASKTYDAEMAILLDAVFSSDEQRQFHDMVTRCLKSIKTELPEGTELNAP